MMATKKLDDGADVANEALAPETVAQDGGAVSAEALEGHVGETAPVDPPAPAEPEVTPAPAAAAADAAMAALPETEPFSLTLEEIEARIPLVAEMVRKHVDARLNEVLPGLVSDLIDPEKSNKEHVATIAAEAEKEQRAREKRDAVAAAKRADAEAKARQERQDAAASAHEAMFAAGVPSMTADEMVALVADPSVEVHLTVSNGQTFNLDFSVDVTGQLAMLDPQTLTITTDIVPPTEGQPFTISTAVLCVNGGQSSVCVVGAGLTMGGGASISFPARSLAFRAVG
jgi:hypothetical protein